MPTVTQSGIEVDFTAGNTAQYVMGDWAIENGAGGIDITEIRVAGGTRVAGSVTGQDGAMIDIAPKRMTVGTAAQGFDSRFNAYSASLDVVAQGYPIHLDPDQSLVISESRANPGSGSHARYLQKVIVITCVDTLPAANTFRPHPYNAAKVFDWNVSDISYTSPAKSMPASSPSVASRLTFLQHPQIEIGVDYPAGSLLAVDNFASDYGREVGDDYGQALLKVCEDPAEAGDLSTLINALVQCGIDHYGFTLAGGDFAPNGGWWMGRHGPVCFAGHVLGDTDMRDVWPNQVGIWGEDHACFYVTQADVDRTINVERTGQAQGGGIDHIILAANTPTGNDGYELTGITIETTGGTGSGQTKVITSWNKTTKRAEVAWDSAVDDTTTYTIHGFIASMIGDAQWGIQHYHEEKADNPSPIATYRTIFAKGVAAETLAMAIMGLQQHWNPAHFDHLDWFRKNVVTTYGWLAQQWDQYIQDMWDAHWDNEYVPGNVSQVVIRAVPR